VENINDLYTALENIKGVKRVERKASVNFYIPSNIIRRYSILYPEIWDNAVEMEMFDIMSGVKGLQFKFFKDPRVPESYFQKFYIGSY